MASYFPDVSASRRAVLRRISWGAAAFGLGGGLAGCVRRQVAGVSAGVLPPDLPFAPRSLPPVHIAPEREIRTVVGLRPFRPSGFRVAREQLGETAVVHNYGHGGGGITLSWGTSKLACDLGLPGYTGSVAVLGCGAVGLATARLAQEAGFAVTLYTKALPPETTSNIAGGQWYPATVFDPDRTLRPEFKEQFVAAARFAYRRYQIMTEPRYGIRWMRNYGISNEPFGGPPATGAVMGMILDLLPEVRDLGSKESPFRQPYVRQYDGLIVEPPMYLPAMLADVRMAGGRIVVREMRTPDEVRGLPERLVFNCTGLGAKALFADAELTPIRGQLTFLVPQPEVRYATTYGNTYMFSRRDGVLLGGTHELGNWSLTPDMASKAEILRVQAELFGSMRMGRTR